MECFSWCSLQLCNFFTMDGANCYRGFLPNEQRYISGDTEICATQGMGQGGKIAFRLALAGPAKSQVFVSVPFRRESKPLLQTL